MTIVPPDVPTGLKKSAVIDLVISCYEEVAGLKDPSLDKLKMQLLRGYAQALRDRASLDRATKAAAAKVGVKKGAGK